jgi:hypothetical protein
MTYKIEEIAIHKFTIDDKEKMSIRHVNGTKEFTLTIQIEDGGEIYAKMDSGEILMLKTLIESAMEIR